MAVTNLNKTTSGGLTPGMQEYFDRKLLRNMKPKLVHMQFGQKRPLPPNNGLTIQFRRWGELGASTTPLTEGVAPEGQMMSQTEVKATIQEYGDVIYISDKLAKTHLDRVVSEAQMQVADQGALSMDHITRDVINAGTNVLYANGKTARNALAATDILTGKEIRKAVRMLKKAKAPKLRGGYYVCIVGPDITYALQQDADWKNVSQYQDKENIYSGEVGKLWGCIFVETTEAKIFEAAGASSADVASALVLGAEAYGVVELDGKNVRTITKPVGSAGVYDPLDQICSTGWKVDGYACKILHEDWIVRIESGVAA